MGATETTVIRVARELARRGHDVTVHTNGEEDLVHMGVRWRPLSARPPETCDVYIAVQQVELLGFVPRPKRRVIWVLWGANQLRHYKKLGAHVALSPDPDPDEPGAGERLLAGAAAPRRHQRDPPAAAG